MDAKKGAEGVPEGWGLAGSMWVPDPRVQTPGTHQHSSTPGTGGSLLWSHPLSVPKGALFLTTFSVSQ